MSKKKQEKITTSTDPALPVISPQEEARSILEKQIPFKTIFKDLYQPPSKGFNRSLFIEPKVDEQIIDKSIL